jgi:hypothetical protein
MQSWIYRAKDLSIISDNTAARLFRQFRVNAWHLQGAWKTLSITF